jgi:hypothetical protein
MPQPLVDLYQYILVKNWFAVAAVTIMIVIQVGKSFPALGQKLWVKIPDGYRFLVPIGLSMLTAFVHGFQTHETFWASLWDAIRIALGAMGGAAALKESPLPWDGGKGGAPIPDKPAAPPAAS